MGKQSEFTALVLADNERLRSENEKLRVDVLQKEGQIGEHRQRYAVQCDKHRHEIKSIILTVGHDVTVDRDGKPTYDPREVDVVENDYGRTVSYRIVGDAKVEEASNG